MQLNEIIEKSYLLFEKYTIGKTLDVCKCKVCITDEAEATLIKTPLRAIPSSLLERAYYNSARLFTDK